MARKVGEPGGDGPPIGGGPGGPPPPPPPPFQPARYVFILNQFHIDNTRAVDEDTDTVSFGVKIGNAMMAEPQIKRYLFSDNGDENFSSMRCATMFEQENALPGPQLHCAISNRHGFARARQNHADM